VVIFADQLAACLTATRCCSPAVRVVGVRDWRFNQHIEDIEWLLKLSAADGSASTGKRHLKTLRASRIAKGARL